VAFYENLKINWQHPDSRIRLYADLLQQVQDILKEIVNSDEIDSMRLIALNKIEREQFILENFSSAEELSFRKSAFSLIDDFDWLMYAVLYEENEDIRIAAIAKISDSEILIYLHDNCFVHDVRCRTLARYPTITKNDKES